RYTLRIQGFGDGRLTETVSIHLEDSPDDRRLFLSDFQLHTTDRKPSVLAATARIFDGDVTISVAFASRLKPVESAAFLSPVHLLAKAYQELLVHHSVKGQ